jgi:hypothetical protein
MKTLKVIVPLLVLTALATASKRPDSDFQDAVLAGFGNSATGISCRPNVWNPNITNCGQDVVRVYTLQFSDGRVYDIQSHGDKYKANVLASLAPGTHVLVRTDGKQVYVRYSNRESKFYIISAH